jgi:hypothetical protein
LKLCVGGGGGSSPVRSIRLNRLVEVFLGFVH